MNKPLLPRAELPAGFDLDTVQWYRLVGGADFDYPVNYAVAVVDADVAAVSLGGATCLDDVPVVHFIPLFGSSPCAKHGQVPRSGRS